MSTNPGVTEMLALLETLRQTIADFAAREEKLERDFGSQTNLELGNFEAGTRLLDARQAALREAAEAALNEALTFRQAQFERRKAAITRAQANARKNLEGFLDQRESRVNEAARNRGTEDEARRDQDLAAATANHEAFQKSLTEAEAELAEFEKSLRAAFRGYGDFRKQLPPERQWPDPDFSPDAPQLFQQFQNLRAQLGTDLRQFNQRLAPKFFRFVPVWLAGAALLGVAAAPFILPRFNVQALPPAVGLGGGVALGLLGVFYGLGKSSATPSATELAGNFAKARRLLDGCFDKAARHLEAERARIKAAFEAATKARNLEWKTRTKEVAQLRLSQPGKIDEKSRRLALKNQELLDAGTKSARQTLEDNLAWFRQEALEQAQKLGQARDAKLAGLNSRRDAEWQLLEKDWQQSVPALYAKFAAARQLAAQTFPEWDPQRWKEWSPPDAFPSAVQFAHLEVELSALAGSLPKSPRLALPGPAEFSAPLSLSYPLEGSILFETGQTGANEAVAAINNIIFRLLSTTPPGKVTFTIFDPVGLGQNFAALMHLADYEESSINSRIWTQSGQFEEKLAELNEHMEKVIQMYLRNEYATIAEFNAEAGSIAEKYHFLVIASFPANFTDTAARRLRNIAASGARCGVYTLIQWDQRTPLPQDVVLEDLRKNSVCLKHTRNGFEFSARPLAGAKLRLAPPPTAEFATAFLHQAGQSSKDSARVQVPFAQVAPPANELWREETTAELRVPIGRSGATKLQYLEVGHATRQHALIAGKTGSGKSTLFHVIITNLALWCSPEQVEFYLVDFKKGVEFKCYANRRLPHARVVAIESDRAFGLSVLQRVDDELRRRGDLFRQVGAQDLAGYKRAGGTEAMPRSLLIIDEFQEFFVEEDRISQGAAVLLDRIVRQGRAFGIHVLLGSQTLGGAYSLARATIGQMVIRIALQCNEADAYLIMDQDNPAPRLLSRPGEGIYNDTAGSIDGNSPFQTVWLSDQERDRHLETVRAHADQSGHRYPGPIVFEGNAPADVRENLLLQAALEQSPATSPAQGRAWLGAPNSIKGPTEAVFQKQSGSNLLIVGQSDERAASVLAVALVSLAAQHPRNGARFIILDSTPPGFPQRDFFQRVIAAVPQPVVQFNGNNLDEIMAGLAEDLKGDAGNPTSGPETFVLIQGLQNFKKLKQEDEFSFSSSDAKAGNPAATLMDLITEGPGRGFHLIATCDTYNNVNRFLGRKTLSEFEMRLLFQMSAADSASLVDSPDAATLGFHRGLFYHDREGYMETFRPYAQPDGGWIESVAKALSER
ncbi:MAG: FtsK/SpoIIIE domain-containing protein [Verrucomicrobiota bacterium]